MKKLLALILVMMMSVSSAMARGESEVLYSDALELLQKGSYTEAAAAFAQLGSYQEASQLAMYCYAVANGENGNYALAVSNLQSLGTFRDASLLATYYCALSYEAAQQYEEARKLFSGLELYKDVASRLLTYPEKIYARDYALADMAEQNGNLEKALAGFTALGAFKDSADRAAAVQEKIWAADYAAADKAEQDGDYATAYDGFIALGSYKDSADRAAAVQVRATYAKGLDAVKQSEYEDAHLIFKRLGDYEDSQEKAYALGINGFASLKTVAEGVATFSFHSKYGLVNINENITVAPQWDSIGIFVDGLAVAEKNGKYGVVNQKGEVISNYQWVKISEYDNGLCVVAKKDTTRSGDYYLFTLMDAQGNMLGNWWQTLGNSKTSGGTAYAYSPQFAEDRIIVFDGTTYGYINSKGENVVPCAYESAMNYANGLAAVKKQTGWGFIDLNGNEVIPFKYSEATSFDANGLAEVCLDGEWQIIDKEDNLVYFKKDVQEEQVAETAAVAVNNELHGLWTMDRIDYGENNGGLVRLDEIGNIGFTLRLDEDGTAVWLTYEGGAVSGKTIGYWRQDGTGIYLGGLLPRAVKETGIYAGETGEIELRLTDGQLEVIGASNSVLLGTKQ